MDSVYKILNFHFNFAKSLGHFQIDNWNLWRLWTMSRTITIWPMTPGSDKFFSGDDAREITKETWELISKNVVHSWMNFIILKLSPHDHKKGRMSNIGEMIWRSGKLLLLFTVLCLFSCIPLGIFFCPHPHPSIHSGNQDKMTCHFPLYPIWNNVCNGR